MIFYIGLSKYSQIAKVNNEIVHISVRPTRKKIEEKFLNSNRI